MSRLSILGSGSWGTALAIALSPRFDSIRLWARDAERAAAIQTSRENARYLAGFHLPACVQVSADLEFSLERAGIVLAVIPSRHFRAVLASLAPFVPPQARFVSATKGIEDYSLCRMSEIIAQIFPAHPAAVLSGPTFAREVAAGEPAAVVVAAGADSGALALAEEIQAAFSTPTLRLYSSPDIVGVELGGALKNIIAIGAGICHGLGLGANSVAALITRGLAEITRLATVMGANPRTLSGLAGLGDLVLTATGDLSRNRFVGIQLGQGKLLPDILAQTTMVAEGVATCAAAHRLAVARSVNVPIIQEMHEVLYRSKDPRQAIRELMDRPLTSE